eukprot:11158292-Prorocentrum_lima.AAC.1
MTSSLVGSEMCIRDRTRLARSRRPTTGFALLSFSRLLSSSFLLVSSRLCLLYTSDAADDM